MPTVKEINDYEKLPKVQKAKLLIEAIKLKHTISEKYSDILINISSLIASNKTLST